MQVPRLVKVIDRPTQTPLCGFAVAAHEPQKLSHKAKTGRMDFLSGFCGCVALFKPSNCSFALTNMSFR